VSAELGVKFRSVLLNHALPTSSMSCTKTGCPAYIMPTARALEQGAPLAALNVLWTTHKRSRRVCRLVARGALTR
jgi:hypothetical protein